jgi:3'5'-cyclic nucleotide phosphodiesterase
MKDGNIRGSIASIIRNDAELYEGNLVHYFQAVFNNARNLSHPYHNFRHIFHVVWLCHEACEYYRRSLSPRERRNLLIAAMFHDFDHTGMLGNDDVNIMLALRGLERHILEEDRGHLEAIKDLIKATQFPYVSADNEIELGAMIIRDADLSQSLSVAWIQQVIFGLAQEWKKKPLEVLRSQIGFTRGLTYNTHWAQESFDLDAKVAEVNELLDLLDFGTPVETATK